MDFRTIKKLMELVEQSNKVTELSVEHEGICIRISSQGAQANTTLLHAPVPAPQTVGAPTQAPAPTPTPAAPTEEPAAPEGAPVRSPMVGVFYSAPAPGAKPFVSVGQHVKPGDTLCIIEAMKMMNHIKAEQAGVVQALHANDGEAVEFDQLLMTLSDTTN